MKVGNREIGPSCQPIWIADIGANHDGSLHRALMLASYAAQSGADLVKYQSFDEKTIASRRGFGELGQIAHQAQWEKSVYEVYADAVLPSEWIPTLAQHCRDLGVGFMSTAYSPDIVDAIDPYVVGHKVGSGDITYHELIRHVASKGKPVLMATGASTQAEIRSAINVYKEETDDWDLEKLVLLQCNTDYRGTPEAINYSNLRVLSSWIHPEYGDSPEFPSGLAVGLSDHTAGHLTVCAAVALGSRVFEKHFTDDRSRKGPDHAFAMEPDEWRRMITAARQTWEALGDGIKRVEENEKEAVIVQRRALRYREDLRAGIELDGGDIIPTRPCPPEALEPYRISELIGRTLKRDVVADTLAQLEDLE